MASKPIYHIEPIADGAWKVSPGPDSQPSSVHATKKEAIESAERLLRQHGAGELIVHRGDGSVEQQRAVGTERRAS